MNTSKVVMNFLQGSIVTQTVLGQPTMYPAVATLLQYSAWLPNENLLTVVKVIAILKSTVFWTAV